MNADSFHAHNVGVVQHFWAAEPLVANGDLLCVCYVCSRMGVCVCV
jgi:hypothetical protein